MSKPEIIKISEEIISKKFENKVLALPENHIMNFGLKYIIS